MSQLQTFPLPRRRHRLWELVAAGGMVLLLAALLYAIFARSPEYNGPACASNLKQLSLAVLQYAQDYDERLPSLWRGPAGNGQSGGWIGYRAWPNAGAGDFVPSVGGLYPYLKSAQVYACPEDGSGRGNSYSLNGGLMVEGARGTGYHQGRRLGELAAAANTVMLVEERHPLVPGPADGCALAGCGIAFRRHGDRRPEGTNVAFADGHVKLHVPATMRAHDELPLWRWTQVSTPWVREPAP